jgi:hypothetical protein
MAGIEATCERKVCDTMKDDWGVDNIKVKQRGYPDRQFILNKGVVVWIEFKAPGEEPTPLQYHRIDELLKNGHYAFWFDDHDDAVQALVKILKRINR